MYTGYSVRGLRIYKDAEETEFHLNGKHICRLPDERTDCHLVQSLSDGVKHIYGPNGYTKFYVDDGHIYGPSTDLPWFDPCDDPQAVDAPLT